MHYNKVCFADLKNMLFYRILFSLYDFPIDCSQENVVLRKLLYILQQNKVKSRKRSVK